MLPTNPFSRQIHLDYHNSPFLPEIANRFDADAFAETMSEARVSSVCVFGKCAQGWSYFPSKVGPAHPSLGDRDFTAEMIDALHRKGIRAPLYTSVGWEERIADTQPNWRQMRSDGRFAEIENSADCVTVQPAKWRWNCWVNPEYVAYLDEHLTEMVTRYKPDGLFIDMLFMHEDGCFCEYCLEKRAELGLLEDTPRNNALYESHMQQWFCDRYEKMIHAIHPEATVFFNSTNRAYSNGKHGWAARAKSMTHTEIESLPSGFWGYYHFPRLARQSMMWDRPTIGMTGKFQRMWGDFGGIKPTAALEYECFRIQALGGGCSVGDQLYPDGSLDRGTYRLIGEVFRDVEEAEPFYADTEPCPQGALVATSSPAFEGGGSDEGAVMMMEELHHDVAVIDDQSPLDRYAFVILADATEIDEAFRERLLDYHRNGGRLIVSHRAGTIGDHPLLPIEVLGDETIVPNYWTATEAADAPELLGDFRVIYSQGVRVAARAGQDVLIERAPSYFNRSDLKYCSHFQTPPAPIAERSPAALLGERYAYFADPIFSEYRQYGSGYLREWVALMMGRLGLSPLVTAGLDPHIHAYPRRSGDDLRLTLLNYIPCRKSHVIDIIERGLSFAGQQLQLDRAGLQPRVWQGDALPASDDGGFALPAEVSGRLLIEVPGYFHAPA